MTPQICYFLVPTICNQIPLKTFIKAVSDTDDCHSLWLLYSYMSIVESRLGMMKFLLSSSFGKTRKYSVHFVSVLVKTRILRLANFNFVRVFFKNIQRY